MHPRCQLPPGRLSTSRIIFQRSHPAQRTFTTTSVLAKDPFAARKGGDLGSHLPKYIIPQNAEIPEYPYGENLLYKQSNKGLYGGQMIQFGNNVSRDTETKTRRSWKPNVLSKGLYSVALKKRVKLRVSSKVLKIIDREGGLDEYLLKPTESRIKELGPMGWALRWTLMQKPEVISRLRAEAAELGIEQELIDKQWPIPGSRTDRMIATTRARADQIVLEEALAEYKMAEKAARRYLTRGMVDSEEDGLRLAFVRAKERAEGRLRRREALHSKVEAVTAEAIEETRSRLNIPESIPDKIVKGIVYKEQKRAQIKEAGSFQAWVDSRDPEAAARYRQQVNDAGGPEAWQAKKKEMYADILSTAQNAPRNPSLATEERKYFEEALRKAEWAIRAKTSEGKQAYARIVLEAAGHGTASRSARLQDSQKPAQTPVDEWATLVDVNTASSGSRINV